MDGYTRDASGNGSVNTFLPLGSRFLITQKLDYKIEELFPAWSVPRCYNQGTRSVDISVLESVKRGLESEAEE
jgi:hypothetical protein